MNNSCIQIFAKQIFELNNEGYVCCANEKSIEFEITNKLIDMSFVDDGSIDYIIPPFMDMHSIAFEKALFPRNKIMIPDKCAYQIFSDASLSSGMCFPFEAIALSDNPAKHRSHKLAEQIVEFIVNANSLNVTFPKPKLHLRVDITGADSVNISQKLINKYHSSICFVSIMNHSPGKGVFQTKRDFVEKHLVGRGITNEAEQDRIITNKLKGQEKVWLFAEQIIACANVYGIAVAIHDPTEDDIERAVSIGISTAEFPVNIETARKAKKEGMYVVVGAPNLINGMSHNNAVSARRLILEGLADIVCSDYLPGCLLYCLSTLVEMGVPIEDGLDILSGATLRAVSDTKLIHLAQNTRLLIKADSDGLFIIRGIAFNNRIISWRRYD